LYRFAIGRVHDPELAADLVQETFLEGLRARSSFSGNSSLRTWLIAILKHKILDWYRRSGRMPRAEADPLSEPAIEGFFDRRGHWKARPGRWGDDPGETLDRGEFWEVLGRCVARLPEHLADAFLAIELGDLGRDRVCEQLQITAANLAVRLYRARLLLRHCLETHWFAGAAPPAALTEKERRRLWNGYRGSFRAEATEVTNLAKVGPEFLLKIGQALDWTVDLTRPRRSGYRGA
jgi:RNA polymerase sigma-70 factor (ECF subfamily)